MELTKSPPLPLRLEKDEQYPYINLAISYGAVLVVQEFSPTCVAMLRFNEAKVAISNGPDKSENLTDALINLERIAKAKYPWPC